jgi:hypothetical protein
VYLSASLGRAQLTASSNAQARHETEKQDAHPGWLKQIRALDLRLANSSENSPRWAEAWFEREHLGQLMCETPATSWEGLVSQITWICDELCPLLNEASDTPYLEALDNMRSSLDHLRAAQDGIQPQDG